MPRRFIEQTGQCCTSSVTCLCNGNIFLWSLRLCRLEGRCSLQSHCKTPNNPSFYGVADFAGRKEDALCRAKARHECSASNDPLIVSEEVFCRAIACSSCSVSDFAGGKEDALCGAIARPQNNLSLCGVSDVAEQRQDHNMAVHNSAPSRSLAVALSNPPTLRF